MLTASAQYVDYHCAIKIVNHMKRRYFNRSLFGFAGAMTLSGFQSPSNSREIKTIKAKRLQTGDTVGLITPGSYISDEALEKAVQNVEGLGLKVKLSKNIRAKRGFTAGTDQERLEDLHEMFQDQQIAGIWCARGGYGCGRLLPQIDYALIQKNPKVLIGYSDITALLLAVYQQTGLVCFHGPVAASEFTPYTKEQVQKVLMEPTPKWTIELAKENLTKSHSAYLQNVFRKGKAKGILIGGNLSLLAALAGTPYALDAKDKIVFIEDIGEKPYRIDRMLTQLRQSANLKQAAGIALGVFEDCEAKEGEASLSLTETLDDRITDLKVPSISGLSFGHIDHQCTFPIGIQARLNTTAQTITLLEPAVL